MNWLLGLNDTDVFIFDYAGLENGYDDEDFLDRESSPVEYITGRTVTESSGITADSGAIIDNATAIAVTVTSPAGSAGDVYSLACRITTNQGRSIERTATITVIDR